MDNKTIKVTSDINPKDLKGVDTHQDRILVNGQTKVGLIPGMDEFSLTTELMENCKLAGGGEVGPIYWNHELGYHTDTHTFYGAADNRQPQHARGNRTSQLRTGAAAACVQHKDGKEFMHGQDLILMAIPIAKVMEEREQAERNRLAADAREEDPTIDGMPDPYHMSPKEKREFAERQREESMARSLSSPTRGQDPDELRRRKGAAGVRMDEIRARTAGRIVSTEQLRGEAEAEVRYLTDKRKYGVSPNPLWAIKAQFAPGNREIINDQRAGNRQMGRTTTRRK